MDRSATAQRERRTPPQAACNAGGAPAADLNFRPPPRPPAAGTGRKSLSTKELEALHIEAKRSEVKRMMQRNQRHMQKQGVMDTPPPGARAARGAAAEPTSPGPQPACASELESVQRLRKVTGSLQNTVQKTSPSKGAASPKWSSMRMVKDSPGGFKSPPRRKPGEGGGGGGGGPSPAKRNLAAELLQSEGLTSARRTAREHAGKENIAKESVAKDGGTKARPARKPADEIGKLRTRPGPLREVQPTAAPKRATSVCHAAAPNSQHLGATPLRAVKGGAGVGAPRSAFGPTHVPRAAPMLSATWTSWSLERGDDTTEVSELFESFRTSRGVEGIALQFAKLLSASYAKDGMSSSRERGTGIAPLDVIRTAVGDQRRYARVLWERLEARRLSTDYCKKPLVGQRAVVVGAGPVGLRCALELALLGAEVVVLERRVEFERINRLHLWPWVGEDLKAWGAKVLEPPELSFGADPDFLHIGIAELQMLLLKPCLLLGVQVLFGVEFAGSSPSKIGARGSAAWDILVKPRGQGPPPPGPPAPERLRGVTVLIGADGPCGSVAKAHSLELQETASLRKEAALGLVMNFANRQSSAEKSRRSFSLARQFYESLFRECEDKTGLALENIVCYISSQTHYFVMTPTRGSLQRVGVLAKDAAEGETLATLDEAALAQVAHAVASFPWKPDEAPLPEETLASPVGGPKLFDFSRTRRAAVGLRVVDASAGNSAASGPYSQMLVGLCGDALIEPFWPEGLGVMRGFFGALDIASAVKVWVESGGDGTAAKAHFLAAFKELKSLAAKTRTAQLRPEENAYALDPSTRYRWSGSPSAPQRTNSMPALLIADRPGGLPAPCKQQGRRTIV